MNKTHFFLLFSLILFTSCFQKNAKTKKVEATKINTISVIIDDQLWYGEVGDSLRNKFASPVLGLTQEEPLFTINQYSAKLLEGFMTKGRNLIVVKKEEFNKFEIKKDEFTSPQNVFRITGKTIDEIIQSLQINAPTIIKMMRETEIEEVQKSNAKALLSPTILKNKFQIDLAVPVGFKYAMQRNNFIWLKKELVGGNVSVLVYEIPLHSFNDNPDRVAEIVKVRDSIGEFITGKDPNTPMQTDDAYSPYFSKMELDDKKAYETRGSWELQNDFMMGPFLNYAIIDEAYNRVLFLEGFCYAPSNEQRDLMLGLEAILKSVKVDKRQE